MTPVWRNFGDRLQHEPPVGHAGVRQGRVRAGADSAVEVEEIEIERPRRVGLAPHPPEQGLNGEQPGQNGLGRQRPHIHLRHGVPIGRRARIGPGGRRNDGRRPQNPHTPFRQRVQRRCAETGAEQPAPGQVSAKRDQRYARPLAVALAMALP